MVNPDALLPFVAAEVSAVHRLHLAMVAFAETEDTDFYGKRKPLKGSELLPWVRALHEVEAPWSALWTEFHDSPEFEDQLYRWPTIELRSMSAIPWRADMRWQSCLSIPRRDFEGIPRHALVSRLEHQLRHWVRNLDRQLFEQAKKYAKEGL